MGKSKRSFIIKAIEHTVGNLIDFPNCELKPMVKKVLNKESEIDLLITIAIPHAIHFGASKAKLNNVKVWVGDCGDPFMGNPFKKRPFYMSRWEKRWCRRCNYITIPIEAGKEAYYPEFHNKIRIIPQGFNFEDTVIEEYKKNEAVTFAYAGYIYPGSRDLINMLDYLKSKKEDFRFYIYTAKECINHLQSFKESLKEKLILHPFVPRNELLPILSKMDFLINICNNAVVQQPSKLIDYAITKRPIINVSTSFTENERVIFDSFWKGDYSGAYHIDNMEAYNIKNVAKQFLDLCYE